MPEFLLYLLFIAIALFSLDFILPILYDVRIVGKDIHFKTFGLTVGILNAESVIAMEKAFIFETIFLNPFLTLGFVNRPRKILMVLIIKTDSNLFKNIICTPKNYALFLETFKAP
jgi:hypothetical protein